MKKNLLFVLAFNEEKNIKNTIENYLKDFQHVLVVNDASTDQTKHILENLKNNNPGLSLINNEKNLGAGYSFQVGIDFIKSNYNDIHSIVKIDGDGQFDKKDVLKIKNLLNTTDLKFIKSNRFWENGIQGNIPTIRFLGNSLASLLIKFITGQYKINDPLNGLFGFNIDVINYIKIPKIFKRYGYPFYLNSLNVEMDFRFTEIKNTVKYNIGEKSQLKAAPLLFKLIKYSLKFFISNIKKKLMNSNLQMSANLDTFFIFLQTVSFSAIYKIIRIRYFDLSGSQSNWLIIFVILQIFSILVIYTSKKIESKYRANNYFDQA